MLTRRGIHRKLNVKLRIHVKLQENKNKELKRIAEAREYANSLGLTVNSGHGINYQNVAELLRAAKFNELNIGHTIVSRALITGMERAVAEMKDLINAG